MANTEATALTRSSLRLLQQAAASFGAGQAEQARTLCEKVLRAHPAAVDALHLMALIRKQQGDPDGAHQLFDRCLDIAPSRADIQANFGNLHRQQGHLEQAIARYRAALQIDANFRPARLALTRALCRSGQGEAACEQARALLQSDRNDTEAWNALGNAERLNGRPEAAERAFRTALELAPGYVVARHNLGALLGQQDRSEEALVELDRAVADGIRGLEIDLNRAGTLIALGRLDEAEALLQQTADTTPESVEAQTLLARLRFMRGRDDYAAVYAAAVEDHPHNPLLAIGYSRVLRGAGAFATARQAVSRRAHQSDDPRLLAELAAIALDTGQYADALAMTQQALEREPDSLAFGDLAIDVLVCNGQLEEARERIAEARQRAPLNQWYVAMQATVARLLGDPLYTELYDYDRFVRCYDLDTPDGWSSLQSFHADLAQALDKRHRFASQPLDQSLRNGTQTARGLLGDPDPTIRALLRELRAVVEQYLVDIGHDAAHPFLGRNQGAFEFSGCWSVRLQHGGYHLNHVHPEGWISSAYYVDVPPEVADAQARPGWIQFGQPRFPLPGADAERYLQPRPGRLVLFPSYLWHGTTPTVGRDARLTVAFDAIPRAPRQLR